MLLISVWSLLLSRVRAVSFLPATLHYCTLTLRRAELLYIHYLIRLIHAVMSADFPYSTQGRSTLR